MAEPGFSFAAYSRSNAPKAYGKTIVYATDLESPTLKLGKKYEFTDNLTVSGTGSVYLTMDIRYDAKLFGKDYLYAELVSHFNYNPDITVKEGLTSKALL